MSCAVSGRLQLGDVGINVRRGQAVGSSAWGLARPQDPDARTHRRWRRANHWLRQRAALLPESDIRILLSTAGSQRLFQNVVRLEDEWVLKSGRCDHRRPGLRLQHRDAGPPEDPRPSGTCAHRTKAESTELASAATVARSGSWKGEVPPWTKIMSVDGHTI
jgi:hypothetical protein